MTKIIVKTQNKRQVIDITGLVQKEIKNSGKDSGAVLIFVLHTTAAVTTADLDPGTDQDYLNVFEKLIPDMEFNHPHDPSHMPDHIFGALIGPSLTLPFDNGKLILGTWQRIVLFEFDGPRERRVAVKIM